MRFSNLIALIVAAALIGCASTETVKKDRGQGESKVYQNAYEQVFYAALAAAKTKKLDVVEDDKASGRILLAHGVTLWSWGERIAVFIKPLAGNSTEVEIVSKPVLSPLNFPPNWPKILFEQIDVELQAGK